MLKEIYKSHIYLGIFYLKNITLKTIKNLKKKSLGILSFTIFRNELWLSAEIAIQIALRMRVRVREYSNGVRGKISACRFFSFFCYFFFQEVVSSLFFCV